MTQGASQALAQALALLRAPRSARPGPRAPLPTGMLVLLKIAAGEEDALAQGIAALDEEAQTVREAAVFFIQQVMFDPEADAYRVLGVAPDAEAGLLREHYRWLARWLHPDRNPDSWEALYVDRVNQAWQRVRTPDRRERYDSELQREQLMADVQESVPIAGLRPIPDLDGFDPGAKLRWLPTAILVGLGSFAIAMLAVLYVARDFEGTTLAEALPPADPSPSLEAVPSPAPVPAGAAVMPVGPNAVLDSTVVPPLPEQADLAAIPASELLSVPVPPRLEVETAEALTDSVEREPEPPLPVATEVRAPRKAAPVPSPMPAPPHVVAATAPPKLESVSKSLTEARVENGARRPRLGANAHQADPTTRPETPQRASRITQRDANRLLGEFSQAYSDGNLRNLRSMFADDVRGSRGGRDAILADYEKLFRNSETRSLVVRNVSWFGSGDSFTIVASFEASIVDGRRRLRRSHGDLRLDLRLEADQWRIYRLLHEERQG